MNDKLKKLNDIELAIQIGGSVPRYHYDPEHNELWHKGKVLFPVHWSGARAKMETIIDDFHSGSFFKKYLTTDLKMTADRAEELENALFALHSALCKLDTQAIRAVEDIGVELLLSTMAQSGQLRDVAREMRDSRSKLPF